MGAPIIDVAVTAVITFLVTLFVLYELVVKNKDAKIDFLNERVADRDRKIADREARIAHRDAKIAELRSRTPDELAKALEARFDSSLKEIARLRADVAADKNVIASMEAEALDALGRVAQMNERLQAMTALIQNYDLWPAPPAQQRP